MMMSSVGVVVIEAVTAVGASLGLEGSLHLYKVRPEALQHLLDHMVRPYAKNLVANFHWQMPISQMPGEANKLIGIFVPDFDNGLRSGLNPEPSPVFKLQPVAVGHRHRFRKVEKKI